jgi:hypothetical protein
MKKDTTKVAIPAEVRAVIAAAAKNLATHLYGPEGPAWGTSFVDLEELAVQVGQAVSTQLLDQALQRQASQPVPDPDTACPRCRGRLEQVDPEPRVVATRAGDTSWREPHRYCRRCRRSFFPSVEAAGD